MSELNLTEAEVEHLLTPQAVREKAAQAHALIKSGGGNFRLHQDKFDSTVRYVLQTIEKNYPQGNIPFHSRWGHFRAGGVDRAANFKARLRNLDPLEIARTELDLVVTSVLLDAGAGAAWNYTEAKTGQTLNRSEGLGVASYHMFLSGIMSQDGKGWRADAAGLEKIKADDLRTHFQVSAANPLTGVDGRVGLLNGLGRALQNRKIFKDGRPGNILDYLRALHGDAVPAAEILRAVLEGFGPIWPGRLSAQGRNLGDVWKHSRLGLVPFHKLSQWLTYSLIEPMVDAGIKVTGVAELTGLAEYRNGGLILDSGLISLNDPAAANKAWRPDSDLIIEWRALTVYFLDLIGAEVQKALKKTPEDFPLAKVLEGGTWWAGRFIAKEKRPGGEPPLQIESDGTVF